MFILQFFYFQSQKLDPLPMKSILQSINLFPQSRMWRVNREPEINHLAGGVVSLILIVAIFMILVFKMIEVFTFSTLTITPQRGSGIEGRNGILTTDPDNKVTKNVMMAIYFPPSAYSASATYFQKTLGSAIALEPCTISHFGTAISQEYFKSYLLAEYHCLPLDKSYQLNGSKTSIQASEIFINVDCLDPQLCTSLNQIFLYVFSHSVDAYNKTDVWSPVLEFYSHYYTANVLKDNYYSFVQNTIQQDRSILPLQNNKITTTGYELSPIVKTLQYPDMATSGIRLRALSSPTYNKYSISYLTVIDALSYIGGIMSVLISMFFFMNVYGKIFVDLFLATLFFRSRAALSFGFFSFLQQTFYIALGAVGCKPNWELAKKRQKLRNTVLNMMNVTFLQRRIEFLEKGLTLVLDKHHLKGLHLLHRMDQSQADQFHKEYQLRERVLLYFNILQRQQGQKELPDLKNKIKSPDKKELMVPQSQQRFSHPMNENIVQNKQNTNYRFRSLNRIRKQMFNRQMNKQRQRYQQTDPDIKDEVQLIKIQQLGESQGLLVSKVQEQVKQDIRKLFQSASGSNPDERSRRIVQMIDGQSLQQTREGHQVRATTVSIYSELVILGRHSEMTTPFYQMIASSSVQYLPILFQNT